VLARAYERLSEATYFLGELLIPVYSAFRALNLAEEAGPSPETGRSSAAVGALLGFIPMHKLARGYLERALSLASESGHLESREFVGMTASYYYSGVGNWQEVREKADGVILLADRLGDKRRWQDVTSHLTSVYYYQGNFAASRALAEELFQIAQQRQDSRFMALAVQEKARYALYTGRFEEAIAHLDALQKLVGDGDEVTVIPLRLELLGLTSMLHLRRAAHQEAQEAAGRSLALAAKVNPSFYDAITGYTGPAEVYLTLWEAQPAGQELARQARLAVRTLGKYSRVFPIGRPRLLLNQGRYDWLSGREKQAFKAWESSLQEARALEMLYDQGMAHYEIARHLDPVDRARKEHVSLAGNICTELNARYDLERVHNL
jgi:tetratricopeptide (TPR) repeat protein